MELATHLKKVSSRAGTRIRERSRRTRPESSSRPQVGVPVLVVGGGCAGRGAALEVAGGGGAGGGGGGGARRVLVLEGGDALLRLPARTRLARNLPHHALDAAVAVRPPRAGAGCGGLRPAAADWALAQEEVARWAAEVCEAAGGEAAPRLGECRRGCAFAPARLPNAAFPVRSGGGGPRRGDARRRRRVSTGRRRRRRARRHACSLSLAGPARRAAW